MLAIENVKNPGLSLIHLDNWVSEARLQPSEWRARSDRAADYYDGKQIDPKMRRELENMGQPVIINNLMAPAIDGVLGLEAKTRQDMKVSADDDESRDMAEALNVKFNEAARISRIDRSCSEAYAAVIKTGLGWVEVNRNSDPFDYPYRTNYVHRREIFWDWTDQSPALKNAKWLFRRQQIDVDTLKSIFPKHQQMIDHVANAWSDVNLWGESELLDRSNPLVDAFIRESEASMDRDEWFDAENNRAATYEVYYRIWDRKPVIKMRDGRVTLLNAQNPIHQALIARGEAEVIIAPYKKMRLAYFIGPHRVADVPSPHPHNMFPYVPFWGFREDSSGAPYGLGERMIGPQDEVNFRRSKLTFLLNKLTIIKDDDAVLGMDDNDLADELFRGDSVVNLNENRQNRDHNAFRVEWGSNLDSQQFNVMQDSMRQVQECAGLYSAFLGQDSNASSGVAIDSLVEQGTTTMAEINDNYRDARQAAGELLLANIIEDIADKETEVTINAGKVAPTKRIFLNRKTRNEIGQEVITNNVKLAKTRVVLSEVPNTPGYRHQMANTLLDAVSRMPEQIQISMMDMVIEMLDLPEEKREEMLKRIREASGNVDTESMTEEELDAYQEQQQLQQKMQEMDFEAKRLELEKLTADIRNLNAKALETEGKASGTGVNEDKMRAEIKLKSAQVKKILQEIVEARANLKQAIENELLPNARTPTPDLR